MKLQRLKKKYLKTKIKSYFKKIKQKNILRIKYIHEHSKIKNKSTVNSVLKKDLQ